MTEQRRRVTDVPRRWQELSDARPGPARHPGKISFVAREIPADIVASA